MKRAVKQALTLISVRHVPIAFACATAWIWSLWVVDYPVSEWVTVALGGYLSLWVMMQIWLFVTDVGVSLMHWRFQRIKAELQITDERKSEPGLIDSIVANTVISGVLLIIIGSSITLNANVVRGLELPPLPDSYRIVGLTLMLTGGLPNLWFWGRSIYVFIRAHLFLRHRRRKSRQKPLLPSYERPVSLTSHITRKSNQRLKEIARLPEEIVVLQRNLGT